MNGKRASQLRMYITGTSVPEDMRDAVYRSVIRWWKSVPQWVRKQASERMANHQFAPSLRMPETSRGGAKPPAKRRRRPRAATQASLLAAAIDGRRDAASR